MLIYININKFMKLFYKRPLLGYLRSWEGDFFSFWTCAAPVFGFVRRLDGPYIQFSYFEIFTKDSLFFFSTAGADKPFFNGMKIPISCFCCSVLFLMKFSLNWIIGLR